MKRRLHSLKRWRLSLHADRGTASQPDEQPVRDDLFGVDQLDRHAKVLAGGHELMTGGGRDLLLSRLSANEHLLRDAYGVVTDAVNRGRRITPAAERATGQSNR